MRGIPMYDLPLHSRCTIINVYCYSMFLFLDQFSPAPYAVVADLQKAAISAIWGKKQRLVSVEHLLRPVAHGGFGLIPLHLHLECGRARWVADLLADTWKEQRPFAALRRRLSDYIFSKILLERNAVRKTFSYVRFHPVTLVPEYAQFTWVAAFAHLPDLPQDGWEAAHLQLSSQLPERWSMYQFAWERLVRVHPVVLPSRHVFFLQKPFRIFTCQGLLPAFQVAKEPKIRVESISRASKALTRVLAPPFQPQC